MGSILLNEAEEQFSEKVPRIPPKMERKRPLEHTLREWNFEFRSGPSRFCFKPHQRPKHMHYIRPLPPFLPLFLRMPQISICFENMLPALGGKHIFEGQPIAFFIKNTTFWTP